MTIIREISGVTDLVFGRWARHVAILGIVCWLGGCAASSSAAVQFTEAGKAGHDQFEGPGHLYGDVVDHKPTVFETFDHSTQTELTVDHGRIAISPSVQLDRYVSETAAFRIPLPVDEPRSDGSRYLHVILDERGLFHEWFSTVGHSEVLDGIDMGFVLLYRTSDDQVAEEDGLAGWKPFIVADEDGAALTTDYFDAIVYDAVEHRIAGWGLTKDADSADSLLGGRTDFVSLGKWHSQQRPAGEGAPVEFLVVPALAARPPPGKKVSGTWLYELDIYLAAEPDDSILPRSTEDHST